MSTALQIVLWGVAAALPLTLNVLTRRGADAVGFGAMLFATWLFGRICGALFSVPESMTLYPVEDALCGTIAALAWRSQRAWWKLGLAWLFVFQCCLHAAFWLAWEQGAKHALSFYLTANNATFALELLVVSWGALAYVASGIVGVGPGVDRDHRRGRAWP